jgi:hypothetical protein
MIGLLPVDLAKGSHTPAILFSGLFWERQQATLIHPGLLRPIGNISSPLSVSIAGKGGGVPREILYNSPYYQGFPCLFSEL